MKKIFNFSFSKIYMISVILISLLILGGYFSYAMFTVSKEKSNAISIVTGNLTYELLVEEEASNMLSVPANTTMEFTVTLNNPNNRVARFNFYYLGSLPDGVTAGYIEEEGVNIPPNEMGINLEKVGSSGSSNTYIIKVTNTSDSEITINLGVEVGLDYNDLSIPDNGHLFEEYGLTLKDALLMDDSNNITTASNNQTYITGEIPNNYIWYSGKLWRAISIDMTDNSVKMITQWNISTVSYNDDGNTSFAGSYMEQWLNDTSVDGFLGNLRDPEKFIKMDSKWYPVDSYVNISYTEPVIDPVGLLMVDDVEISQENRSNYGYINNYNYWWTISPYVSYNLGNVIFAITEYGKSWGINPLYPVGTRPAVNLKPGIKIASGDGTEENPYRLVGDNDTDLAGTYLKERYSGEYISFGVGDNNLYRIVSHETDGLTKVTSAQPLKESGAYKLLAFGDNIYSSTNTIGSFLNGEYLNSEEYLTTEQVNMIEDNTTWYLGNMDSENYNYKLAKYANTTDDTLTTNVTTAKIGLLRYGELMAGIFIGDENANSNAYYTLTSNNNGQIFISSSKHSSFIVPTTLNCYIKPAFNLKENVIITGGTGTKEDPFEITLSN